MGKVAVFRSIGRAYGFGFGHFGTALTICWLPYALIVAAGFFLFVPAMGSLLQNAIDIFPQATGTLDDEQAGELARHFLITCAGFYRGIVLFSLICLFLRAMVAVGLTRASTGLEEDGFYYFSLGGPVWKLFGAWIATFLIVYAAKVVLIIVAILIGAIAGVALFKVSVAAAIGCGVLLGLAVIGAIIYISVRLNFFLPPVIVSEKKLDILRSWTLSEGNFWRIVVIYIALCLPFLIFICVADGAVFVMLMPHLPIIISNALAVHAMDLAPLAQGADWLLPWIPPLLAIALLAHVLFVAMLYAATARAYRSLVATDVASQTES